MTVNGPGSSPPLEPSKNEKEITNPQSKGSLLSTFNAYITNFSKGVTNLKEAFVAFFSFNKLDLQRDRIVERLLQIDSSKKNLHSEQLLRKASGDKINLDPLKNPLRAKLGQLNESELNTLENYLHNKPLAINLFQSLSVIEIESLQLKALVQFINLLIDSRLDERAALFNTILNHFDTINGESMSEIVCRIIQLNDDQIVNSQNNLKNKLDSSKKLTPTAQNINSLMELLQ